MSIDLSGIWNTITSGNSQEEEYEYYYEEDEGYEGYEDDVIEPELLEPEPVPQAVPQPAAQAPEPSPAQPTGKKSRAKKTTTTSSKPRSTGRSTTRSPQPQVAWTTWALIWGAAYILHTLPFGELFRLLIGGLTSPFLVAFATVAFYGFHRLWGRSLNYQIVAEFLMSYIGYLAVIGLIKNP